MAGLPPIDRLDALVPPELRRDAATQRRARLVVLFPLVLSVMSALMGAFLAVRLELAGAALCLAAALGDLVPIAVLWGTRSLAIAGFLPGGLGSVLLAAFVWNLGGIQGQVLFWDPLLVVVSMLLSGRRGAAVTLLVQLAILGGFVAIDYAGVALPPPMARIDTVGMAATYAALSVTTALIVSLFEAETVRANAALQERNAETRVLLDSVGQGFLALDPAGRLLGDRSAAADAWFGIPAPGATLWTHLGAHDPAFGTAAEVGWTAIVDDVLPLALCLDQLPARLRRGASEYRVEYRPVDGPDGRLHRVVAIVTDVTELLARERAEADQRDLASALDHAFRDRSGFQAFLAEGEALLRGIDPTAPDGLRRLHTLKGTAAMFGAQGIARRAHALESHVEATGSEALAAGLPELTRAWEAFRRRVEPVVGARARAVEVDPERLAELRRAVRERRPPEVLDDLLATIAHEPVAVALRRAADHARELLERLGKAGIVVVEAEPGLSVDPARWGDFWAAFGHLVRNAADHGIEPPDVRAALGKPSQGTIRLEARRTPAGIEVGVTDNGGGIDWAHVADAARRLALPHATDRDLADSLFTDGMSTADAVSELSGRGVGLGAFRDAVERLGGRVQLRSEPGYGTRVTATIPLDPPAAAPPPRGIALS